MNYELILLIILPILTSGWEIIFPSLFFEIYLENKDDLEKDSQNCRIIMADAGADDGGGTGGDGDEAAGV